MSSERISILMFDVAFTSALVKEPVVFGIFVLTMCWKLWDVLQSSRGFNPFEIVGLILGGMALGEFARLLYTDLSLPWSLIIPTLTYTFSALFAVIIH